MSKHITTAQFGSVLLRPMGEAARPGRDAARPERVAARPKRVTARPGRVTARPERVVARLNEYYATEKFSQQIKKRDPISYENWIPFKFNVP